MFPDLEARVNDADRELHEARAALKAARIAAAPFQVGDEVVALVRTRWTAAIIRSVVAREYVGWSWYDQCDYEASPRVKDGSWGVPVHVGGGSVHEVGWEPSTLLRPRISGDML
jgi:hypothetical protein